MFKRKWNILAILLAFSLFLTVPLTVIGASNEDDVTVRNTQEINDKQKAWTIKFSQPLKESSIKQSTIYVEDENYRLFFINITFSDDKKSITVTPRDPYQENKTYRLHISKDITSEKGKKLEKKIILPFILGQVDEDKGSTDNNPPIIKQPITNVTITPQTFASRISVVSNDSVNRVTANSKDMHYEGNNAYSIGLTNLTSGSSVKIEAYDLSNKKIFSKDYKVN